ncbi:MAG: glycosyltransferase family 4 protein, partial [Caldimonas sp.]
AALDGFAPDLVHVMAMGSRGTAQIAATLGRYPWVFTCHSAPPYERKVALFHGNEALHYGARYMRFLPNTLAWRWLLSRGVMPHVVVHSEFVRRIVMRYGCAAANTSLISLGHDAEANEGEAAPKEVGPSPEIVTVGGLAHTKGQHDMIAALPELARDFPGAKYKIIGEVRDRSYADFLLRSSERLGLDSQVELLHGLSNEARNEALRHADVYVQPSHEEGFCLAFIEAAGVVPRIVGTDTGAIRSICADDAAARVVPVRSPHRLAAAVSSVLGSVPPAGSMQRRAERLRDRFDWSHYLDAHERLYVDLVRKRALSSSA